MATLSQLVSILSRQVEEVAEFLERLAEAVDTTPWKFGGHDLNVSSAYVEPLVLTAREQERLMADETTGLGPREINPSETPWHTDRRPTSAETAAPRLRPRERHRSEWTFERKSWRRVIRFGAGQRWVLLGEPGGGKTSATSHTVAQLARRAALDLRARRVDLDKVVAPLWITAAHLFHQPDNLDSGTAVLAALRSQGKITSKLTPCVCDWLSGQLTTRGCALIIDALDELSPTHAPGSPGTSAVEEDRRIEVFTARLDALGNSRNSLVVTCRTEPWDAGLHSIVRWENTQIRVELNPLHESQQRRYARRYFRFAGRPELAAQLERLLRNNAALREHARTPLILTFACGLLLEGQLTGQDSLRTLYRAVVLRLLSGEWRRNRSVLPPWTQSPARTEVVCDFLTPLAFSLFVGVNAGNRFDLNAWNKAWAQARQSMPQPEEAIDHLENLLRLGLLVDGGRQQGRHTWSFAHRTVFEFLVADYLASLPAPPSLSATGEAGRQPFSQRLKTRLDRFLYTNPPALEWLFREKCPFLNAPEWRQVLVFLANFLPEPRRLIDAIQRFIDYDKEDVFRTFYALQNELAMAIPEGDANDRWVKYRAERWLLLWNHVLLFNEYYAVRPGNKRAIARKELTAMEFSHGRLLAEGRNAARHPVAARFLAVTLAGYLERDMAELRAGWVKGLNPVLKVTQNPEIAAVVYGVEPEEFCLRVIETLGQLRLEAAVPALQKILEDPDQPARVRAKAAHTLGDLASESSAPVLLSALHRRNPSVVRAMAAWALGQIGSREAVDDLRTVLALEPEDEGSLRLMAANALGTIGAEAAVDVLQAAIRQPPADWTDAANLPPLGADFNGYIAARMEADIDRTSGNVLPQFAAQALIDLDCERATLALIGILDSDDDDNVRAVAASVLGGCDNERAFAALRDAFDPQMGQSTRVREGAALGLGHSGDRRCLSLLFAVLESPQEENRVRIAALEAIGSLGFEEAVEPLRRVFHDRAYPASATALAAWALGEIGSEKAVQVLLSPPDVPDQEIHTAIFCALCDIGSPRALSYFRKVLQRTHNPALHVRAAEALGRTGCASAVPDLLTALKRQEFTDAENAAWMWVFTNALRKEAAAALGALRTELAIPALLDALRPPAGELQIANEREAARFADVEARGEAGLFPLCEDWEVRAAAAKALGQIGCSAPKPTAENLLQALLSTLALDTEDHRQVTILTREAAQVISQHHHFHVNTSKAYPPFQDVAIF